MICINYIIHLLKNKKKFPDELKKIQFEFIKLISKRCYNTLIKLYDIQHIKSNSNNAYNKIINNDYTNITYENIEHHNTTQLNLLYKMIYTNNSNDVGTQIRNIIPKIIEVREIMLA